MYIYIYIYIYTHSYNYGYNYNYIVLLLIAIIIIISISISTILRHPNIVTLKARGLTDKQESSQNTANKTNKQTYIKSIINVVQRVYTYCI